MNVGIAEQEPHPVSHVCAAWRLLRCGELEQELAPRGLRSLGRIFMRFAIWSDQCFVLVAAKPIRRLAAMGIGALVVVIMLAAGDSQRPVLAASAPWSAGDLVQPADLAKELAEKKANGPTVLYVGFRPLFVSAHIPGALFHGAASSATGLAELKKWAATLPKSTSLVIYCGCCPFGKCPNVGPAFSALQEMGFTQVRVLALPDNFNDDWIGKGFPVEKGL
jgi:thiosulfate/3-mercaptopyruvate sulfurtransferase